MNYYSSPRWSGEILDCSMPMTFDTYNKCSFNCLYCFSYFQKSHKLGKEGKNNQDYQSKTKLTWVNPEKTCKLFLLNSKSELDKQFFPFIRDKIVMQWGGMADQFDEYERKHGISLQLLEFFKSINYPLCFSTKGTWWIYDDRYRKLMEGQDNWNCKFSIINLDEDRAKKMERGVDSPLKRLEAGSEYTKLSKGGFTLRLRPFIIGFTDKDDEYLELIKLAKEHGASAVSTEFFCLEARADASLKARYNKISEIIGFDIYNFYRKHSKGSGYRRLNYNLKKKYIENMQELCNKLNLRFYVSDAHHKEKCYNGSCCGLPENWNYSKGQFTEALIIARRNGTVKFSNISKYLDYTKLFQWVKTEGFNYGNCECLAKRKNQSMFDYIREQWNTPNTLKSPYKYFEGILFPVGLDENNDVIYKFNYEKAGMEKGL